MRFTVTLCTDNAAFEESDLEVVRILRDLATKIENHGLAKDEVLRLRDYNGNRVGFAVLSEEPVGVA